MKTKLIFISFNIIVVSILLAVTYPLVKAYRSQLPEGAQFESLEDFRRSMLGRDERDIKPDKSVSFRSIILPSPSDRIIYDLAPNLDVKFQGQPLKTNSFGMRGAEPLVEKSPGVLRIALLGDSFGFGWGVKQEEGLAQIMEDILNKKLTDKTIEVLNFSVPGYSTFQQVAQFKKKGLQFKPDIVLIYFVNNDFGLPLFIKNIHKEGSFVHVNSFINKVRQKKDIEIANQHHQLNKLIDPNQAISDLMLSSQEHDFDVFLAINPRKHWLKDRERLVVLDQDPSIHLVPIRKKFLDIIAERNIDATQLSLKNDPHPNPHKHSIYGEILANEIFSHLTQ